MAAESEPKAVTGYPAERVKAFVDAAVAIALTLLILPLMESVSEVVGAGDDATAWLLEHSGQLLNFLLSFVLIAMFWIMHHRLFASVERVTVGLIWLLAAWLLTIVWLPVATAIAGGMSDEDAVAKTLYIGSLVLVAVMSLVIRLYLRAHPALHALGRRDLLLGLTDDISLVLLFALALAITLLIPVVGYYSLLVMALSGPAQKLIAKVLGAGRPEST
jgi:uncharacterized membrane protein